MFFSKLLILVKEGHHRLFIVKCSPKRLWTSKQNSIWKSIMQTLAKKLAFFTQRRDKMTKRESSLSWRSFFESFLAKSSHTIDETLILLAALDYRYKHVCRYLFNNSKVSIQENLVVYIFALFSNKLLLYIPLCNGTFFSDSNTVAIVNGCFYRQTGLQCVANSLYYYYVLAY